MSERKYICMCRERKGEAESESMQLCSYAVTQDLFGAAHFAKPRSRYSALISASAGLARMRGSVPVILKHRSMGESADSNDSMWESASVQSID